MVKPTCTQSSTSPMEHVSDIRSSSSKYRGVRKRNWRKWVSEIRLPNSRRRIWLGSYESVKKAGKAFDAALYCLRGPNANFNFPENPPEIVGGMSLSPPEIRVVAAKFANQVYDHETSNNNNNNNNDDLINEYYVGTKLSSLVSVSDGTTVVTEIENAMGWSSFLSMLDTNYDFYSPTSHYLSSDQIYIPPLLLENWTNATARRNSSHAVATRCDCFVTVRTIGDNIDDNRYDDDDFLQSSSFLWNF